MKKYIVSILFFCFLFVKGFSQISPPGMGKAQTADWFALGVKQDLDTLEEKGWQSMSYIGVGRKNNYNPFNKPSILVVNQEFYHQFHKTWQYSLAFSYRRQNEYIDNPSYEKDNPNLKQEFRLYSRISYIFSNSRIKFIPTFRHEYRKFFSPDFDSSDEIFQFRSRFRLQLTVNLDTKKRHRLITSSEQLFSISKKNTPNTWTDFNYQESRFALYYSYSPKTVPFVFSIGYMNNLVGQKNPYDVNYLAFDIVIKNPFKLH